MSSLKHKNISLVARFQYSICSIWLTNCVCRFHASSPKFFITSRHCTMRCPVSTMVIDNKSKLLGINQAIHMANLILEKHWFSTHEVQDCVKVLWASTSFEAYIPMSPNPISHGRWLEISLSFFKKKKTLFISSFHEQWWTSLTKGIRGMYGCNWPIRVHIPVTALPFISVCGQ